MSDYREGLHLVPQYMHDSVKNWVEHHQPEPRLMGMFFRSVLANQLTEAWVFGDVENKMALMGWAQLLHDYMPSPAWGSEAQLQAWHDARVK
jgi:hypothetical protein